MVAHGKQPQENSPFILTLYILRGDGPGHRVAGQELKNPARRYNVGGSRLTRDSYINCRLLIEKHAIDAYVCKPTDSADEDKFLTFCDPILYSTISLDIRLDNLAMCPYCVHAKSRLWNVP